MTAGRGGPISGHAGMRQTWSVATSSVLSERNVERSERAPRSSELDVDVDQGLRNPVRSSMPIAFTSPDTNCKTDAHHPKITFRRKIARPDPAPPRWMMRFDAERTGARSADAQSAGSQADVCPGCRLLPL